MNENVVQWVMLRETAFLAKHLHLPLRRKLAEYQTTDYGIIDFACDTANDEVAVVELETEVASTSKLSSVLNRAPVTRISRRKSRTRSVFSFFMTRWERRRNLRGACMTKAKSAAWNCGRIPCWILKSLPEMHGRA